ncbi:MAG TPA: cupin domain-containing protein [Solirubrobacteraceae bacterium]
MTLAHWDDVEAEIRDVGDMRASFRRLGRAAGATAVGVALIDIEPGCRSGPVHQHTSEEEIFFVLSGTGLAWIDGAVHEVGPGDTIVCLAAGPLHTLIAGDDGLSVLAYGENHAPPVVRLPRAGMVRRGAVWLDASPDDPLEREAAAGPLDLPAPTPRPPCSVALDDVEVETDETGDFAIAERDVGRAAGSVRSGLRYNVVPPGKLNCPPHWHSAEHELFVVLEGAATLELYDNQGALAEEHALRPGHCVARPAGTNRAHMLRAGDEGLTYLAYGTREPSEIVYYPRSKKAWLGRVMARLELVDDYWDGEV